ncbi:MAG TPA: ANTAR domain-containing protein [Streptomyces sp.]|nr:ANTAR domain-containing protein [Streptomyces sp.]
MEQAPAGRGQSGGAEKPREAARAADLRQAIALHMRVDEAVGVLMAVGHLRPSAGRAALRAASRRTGIKLGHVAQLVIDWAQSGHLASDIRAVLEQELARDRAPATTDLSRSRVV